MTPRHRTRALVWTGFALLAVAIVNGFWTAGLQ